MWILQRQNDHLADTYPDGPLGIEIARLLLQSTGSVIRVFFFYVLDSTAELRC